MAEKERGHPAKATGNCFMWKQHRLTKRAEFEKVRRDGKAWGNPWVVVYASPNAVSVTRFGFSIGRRLGTAVVRNRVRRRLREIVRRYTERLRPGWDLVIIARQRAVAASYQELQAAMHQALERTGLLAERGSNDEPETGRGAGRV
ncbi:MAG: ribonuclease P protein component [Bacteroidetes bacterium]|nr:ribonuclease P protein component [Bacteroidota bacterium]MCL5026273.1 ribonuclease P protein component [Chloroflexota bacterium]